MKKVSVTIVVLLLTLILGSTVAYAHFSWCPDDPVLIIGGRNVSVTVWVPTEKTDLVNGPVHVKVYVPRNVGAYVVSEGTGYGKGEKVTIISNKKPVEPGEAIQFEVEVKVSATETFPVRVTVGPTADEADAVAECSGQSKKWVKCEATLWD